MTGLAAQVVVLAKAPLPGRAKTRLTPPFTPVEAAALAQAALADTLHAVARARVARRVLALSGKTGRWLPGGFDVVSQRGDGLDERIASAISDAYRVLPVPVVLIGMDTPQVTAGLLEQAAAPLSAAAADAAFGPAADGGFWLLGLRDPDPALIRGVPMSAPGTGLVQLRRLTSAGLTVHRAPELVDVDTAGTAASVAGRAPGSRFAATLAQLTGERPPAATSDRCRRAGVPLHQHATSRRRRQPPTVRTDR